MSPAAPRCRIHSAPVDLGVLITPAAPGTTSALEAIPSDDADGHTRSGTLDNRWFRDAALAPDLTESIVPADRTARGEVWEVEVEAKNRRGKPVGTVRASVTIQNSAPTIALQDLAQPDSLTPSVVSDTYHAERTQVLLVWFGRDLYELGVDSEITTNGDV